MISWGLTLQKLGFGSRFSIVNGLNFIVVCAVRIGTMRIAVTTRIRFRFMSFPVFDFLVLVREFSFGIVLQFPGRFASEF